MGIVIALMVSALWGGHLGYLLTTGTPAWGSPLTYLHILVQAYLYTGLFITAHDAMHGTVSRSKTVNRVIGTAACFLFAGLSYNRLVDNHFKHHRTPAALGDPDFYTGSNSFLPWFAVFMFRYTTLSQLIIMAVVFNLLALVAPQPAVVAYWVVPALLGTLQLFTVGTYLPHRKPHTAAMEPHRARSQKLNHLLAMLSCYFFGYHHEHHEHPAVPWWQLYRVKEGRLPVRGYKP